MESISEEKDLYIRADENKRINKRCIIWVKQMDECIHICTKSLGCDIHDTHKVCRNNNNETYKKLMKEFQYSD